MATSADLPPNPIQGTPDPDVVYIEVVSTHLTVDLSAWTFEDWDPEVDYVFIDGSGRTEALSLTGSTEWDMIAGGAGADAIDAGAGDDTIIGFSEGDVVDGGEGTDTLVLAVSTTIADDEALVDVEKVTAADAEDGVALDLGGQSEGFVITGSAHADTITGGQGEDEIDAGSGDDTIVGFSEGDVVDGGEGTDTLVLAVSTTIADDDALIDVEAVTAADAEAGVILDLGGQAEGFVITGSGHGDTITGGQGADAIDAGADDDTIVGFTAGDSVDGGEGTDTLVLAVSTTIADNDALVDVEAVTAADAEAGVVLDLGGQDEGFVITGSGFGDTITGGQGADEIDAGAGDDTIIGFSEGDSVDGGEGTDTLVLAVSTTIADDEALVDVEKVTAADAEDGVVIDLGGQDEGFVITGSGFGDTITGGQGEDAIDAGAGDDTIIGFSEGDVVDGGEGTDTLVLAVSTTIADDEGLVDVEAVTAADAEAGVVLDLGGQDEGFVITGSGFGDTITGGQGEDEIDAGAGDDTIVGFSEGDVVDGGEGTDTLVLGVSTTIADDDALVDVEKVTAADAEAGVVLDLGGQAEGFVITGSAHADTITGGQGEDEIDAGSGDDTIIGFSEGDVVDGGEGTDTLVLAVSTTIADDDALIDVEAVTAADAEAGVVLDLGGQAEGFVITGSGFGDTITGGQGADEIDAGAGDDTIVGFSEGDVVDGGEGTDTLVLAASTTIADDDALVGIEKVTAADAEAGVVLDLGGQDEGFVITGSGHADTITGGQGEDEIDAGAGDDTIIGFSEGDVVDGGEGTDTLVLAVSTTIADDDALVDVEKVTAADAEAGVVLDLGGQAEGFVITGSGHGDTITGGQGADAIDAGADDDTIVGFSEGDVVDGGEGTDTLVLAASTTIADDDALVDVEAVTAADAEAGVALDLGGQAEGFVITGSGFGDTITGGQGEDEIDAGSGDDTIVGFTAGDSVDGGAGTDTLVLGVSTTIADDDALIDVEAVTAADAEAGVILDLGGQAEGFVITGSGFGDTITGGQGEDAIDAGAGDDTIIGFSEGDTVDGGDGTDTLVLKATSLGLNAAGDGQVKAVEIVSAASAEAGVTIDLGNQSDGYHIVGSAHADTIVGSSTADDVDAGAGDDTIIGFVDADNVNGGSGFDTLSLAGTSAFLNAAADNALTEVERVSAISATAAVVIDLAGQSDGFEIIGGAFGDTITGSTAGDMIRGGAGDDTIVGFVGADRIDGGTGVNTLVLDATSSWLNAAADGDLVNVAVVAAQAATAPITIDLSRQGEGFTIAAGGFGDTIAGGQGADTIDAGAGNDIIVGFAGADRIDGGDGDDTLVLAATSASLNAAADADLVGIESVTAAGALTGIVIDLSAQREGFAMIGGAFGDVLTASAGADRIDGGAGDDVLTGGFGFDVVRGGDGNDVLRATSGDGNDVYDGGSGTDIVDYSATSAGVKVDLTAEDRSAQAVGGDPGSIAALMAAGGFGTTTPVGMATGGETGVDILNGIENVIGSLGGDTIFGDGAANLLEGLAGGDRIWGRGGADTIHGGDGDDVLVGDFGGSGGGSGNDTLLGDSGDDQLYGEDGDDVLTGGTGSDQYAGGGGSDLLIFDKDRASDTAWGGGARDTFRFEKGFGKDRIKDFLATGSSSDKIDLSDFNGLKFGKLNIKQKGADVQITSKKFANGDKITLEVVNAGALTKKDFIFAKKKKSKDKAESDHNHKLAKVDMLDGTAGDDVLVGGKGADTLVGGKGSDLLTGGSGRDAFVFKSADEGLDTITDFRSGKDRLDISADGFGGGLHAGETVTLVKLADIGGHVQAGNGGVFLFATAGEDHGMIYWNANGGSSADAVAIARINSDILFASDFQVT